MLRVKLHKNELRVPLGTLGYIEDDWFKKTVGYIDNDGSIVFTPFSMGETITITGEDIEWTLVNENPKVYQNKILPNIFKEEDRFDFQPYCIDAITFIDEHGIEYTGKNSMKPITFPYTPVKQYGIDPDNPNPLNLYLMTREEEPWI